MITPDLVEEVLGNPDGLIKQSKDKVVAYRFKKSDVLKLIA